MTSYSHLRLTPVREEAKVFGSASYVDTFSGYDEHVPMVDKAVDTGWKKKASFKKLSASIKGTPPESPTPPATVKAPEGHHVWIMAMLMTFFMTLYTLFYSVANCITKKLPEKSSDHNQNKKHEFAFDTTTKEEFRPPSPSRTFSETELLSSVLKRLGELEEKVDTLKAKPPEMPYEKEELLNAAVCRVDALEAEELIATKKALHEALMRQEELLAYIDGQEEAKFRKKKSSCW